jgi:excisionase family DNA binding protein
MAEDRFVSEMAARVAVTVIHAIRNEGIALNGFGSESNGAKVRAGVAPKLLRVDEAAVMLARTANSIRHLINKGELRVVRHGRSVRIAIDDLMDFIERGRS